MKKLLTLYQRLFRKRLAYQTVFDPSKPEVRIVLADLAKVCPANPAKGAGNPIDEKKVFINIGRREVLNHITALTNLPDEKLNALAQEEDQYAQ